MFKGTAFNGGIFGGGTVFKINVDGTGFTNLHSFTADDGARPNAGLILSGDIHCMERRITVALRVWAPYSSLPPTDWFFTVLHEFSTTTGVLFTNSDGGGPMGGLLLSGGTL